MTRAQVALEFILYVILGIVVTLILSAVAINLTQDARSTQAQEALQDLAYTLQGELITAASVHDGYHRVIELPQTISGTPYEVSNTKESITLAQPEGITITLATPPLDGNFTKGINTVTLHDNDTIAIS